MPIFIPNDVPGLPRIVAVVGATASGKTALGAQIAQKFNGEIVSCDAKQVYRGMDIGTAKELDLPVKQHLIDFKEPGEKITVAEYQELAYQTIDQLLSEKKLPVLVGGTMLYASAVIEGYRFGKASVKRYNTLMLGIKIDREELRSRVAVRTNQWLEMGLLEEIKGLLNAGVSPDWLRRCGMEYSYFTDYFLGNITLDEAVLRTNFAINQYIKRQYTWWRRYENINWVANFEEAEECVKNWGS